MTISKKRLAEIAAIKDKDIDYSDIPELDKSFWARAELQVPEKKERITVRIDHDILEWLKDQGPGYQTRMNAILRQYMQAKIDL
ncbi:MAG: BrnA antitoxin family protein [Deltaproteobacteria bacterium]|nr:BrnA antitoxin family protein [Deltaproteobacteria bacterium]